VSNKTAELVGQAIINRLSPMRNRVKTITFDNGKEFANHRVIDQALSSTAYFAGPFASWQRGSEAAMKTQRITAPVHPQETPLIDRDREGT